MKAKDLVKELEQASGIDYNDIPQDNRFKEIGTDGNNLRLGWYKPPSFTAIRNSLEVFSQVAIDKEEFIFVGMGGSVNGIKALKSLTKADYIHTLDSLDPAAIEELLSKIKDLKKCLICAISKSGTTKETQLIAKSLKSIYKEEWKKHLIWIADKPAFDKLDYLGWKGAQKITIQVDKRTDIGGRFTSPHTMVFLAPLFLVFGRDLDRVASFWDDYLRRIEEARDTACNYAERFIDSSLSNFRVEVKDKFAGSIDNWVIQLFQESLGSKIEGYSPKTVVCSSEDRGLAKGFNVLSPEWELEDNFVYMVLLMYFLQVFVAMQAAFKKINFVNQPYVEIYKKELKSLENKDIYSPGRIDFGEVSQKVEENILPEHAFIDVVLYFSNRQDLKNELYRCLKDKFPNRRVSLFEGSDWNHHSYQAAFKDSKTLFIVGLLDKYVQKSEYVSQEQILENVNVLKAIGFATYNTIKDKCLYFCL